MKIKNFVIYDNRFCKCKKIVCILLVVFLYCCVNLCSSCTNYLNTEPAILAPSKIDLVDWKHVLFNILKNELFFNNIENGSVLLVNLIKDKTNGISLQVNNITNILIQCIAENTTKYNVVDMGVLNSVYRELGIFPEDSRNTYSFAMKIANYLRADYILYGMAYGVELENINLELQLISVKTGEILRVISSPVKI